MSHSTRGSFAATVLANDRLCREHYRLTLRVPGLPPSVPGQFVQLACRDAESDVLEHAFDWSPDARPAIVGREFRAPQALLRRPFSLAGRDGDAIEVIGREVGVGTRFLADVRVGQALDVLGPLGNGFARPTGRAIALLVGGGVGIPPMLYLAQALASAEGVRSVAFAGATTRDLMPLNVDDALAAPSRADTSAVQPLYNVVEFARASVPAVLTTDDGSLGRRGYVTDALVDYLDRWITDNADRARTTIYTCGPEPMMRRVQQIAAARQLRCQVAVERAMACGVGTCQSCVIRVRKLDPSAPPLAGQDLCYRLACTDGPVFEGDALLW